MASAIDSGVDTGNDSNDSTVLDKLSKMDFETHPQQKSPDSGKETSAAEEEREDYVNASSSSEVSLMNHGPDRSLAHLQPSTLMHGYEYQPKPPTTETCIHLSFHRPTKDIGGVFVSGGPLGTEYKGSELANKLRMRHGYPRFRCLRIANYLATHRKLRDAARMCRAACQNNTDAMRQMLESGMSPNVHDGYRRTPLHLAACMGYADMVKLLLDHGADPNAKDSIGNIPLHLAACTNHVAVITLLLKAGTRVGERDMAGHSPLQLAITKFNIMKRSIMPHPVLKEQVCQVITMLTEYMRRKEGATIDPDLLNKFESLVRVSDSTEQVETNIRDLLSNLSSLSISSTS